MKRTASLMIAMLLLLSGCSVRPAGETVKPSEPVATPTPAPGESEPPAPPEETLSPTPEPLPPPEPEAPAVTQQPGLPIPDQIIVPTPDAGLDEAARYEAALAWCEANRSAFSDAALYAMDRSYWFADYAPGVETVSVNGNAWESVYFYEDTTGTQTVEEAASVLVGMARTAGVTFGEGVPELMDWETWKKQIADRAAYNTEGGDIAAVERFLAEELAAYPAYYPGIGADMWLCGGIPDVDVDFGWFIIMKQGNVYRLQHSLAFAAYAGTPELQARIRLDAAMEAVGWFYRAPMPLDREGAQDPGDGSLWYRVDYPGVTSMLELRAYLKTLFSDEIVDALMGQTVNYKDIGGVLHAREFAGSMALPTGKAAVVREGPARILCQLEDGDYVYELVGERWIFTEFSWPG